MEQITRIGGNGKEFTLDLPKLVMITKREINDVAMAHITRNTGLVFTRTAWGYEAQPETGTQITALLMIYSFKTRYYNCNTFKNELHLKSDHHIGFQVDSICYDCVKANHIVSIGLQPGDRLAS